MSTCSRIRNRVCSTPSSRHSWHRHESPVSHWKSNGKLQAWNFMLEEDFITWGVLTTHMETRMLESAKALFSQSWAQMIGTQRYAPLHSRPHNVSTVEVRTRDQPRWPPYLQGRRRAPPVTVIPNLPPNHMFLEPWNRGCRLDSRLLPSRCACSVLMATRCSSRT